MGPERKDNVQPPDGIDRMAQDADALILASKRLAEEMRALAERAQNLATQQVEILNAMKRVNKKK